MKLPQGQVAKVTAWLDKPPSAGYANIVSETSIMSRNSIGSSAEMSCNYGSGDLELLLRH